MWALASMAGRSLLGAHTRVLTYLLGIVHLLAVDKLLMHQHTVTHIEAHGGAAGNADARTAVVVSALRCARRGGRAVLALASAAPCRPRRCRAGRGWPHARGWHVPLEAPTGVGLGGGLGGDLARQYMDAGWILATGRRLAGWIRAETAASTSRSDYADRGYTYSG